MSHPYRTDALAALHDEGRWGDVPVIEVNPAHLTPTQPALTFDRLRHLLDGGEPETGDPHPHVVSHRGALYVHDGHHRYAIALLRGLPLAVRLVHEDEAGEQ